MKNIKYRRMDQSTICKDKNNTREI